MNVIYYFYNFCIDYCYWVCILIIYNSNKFVIIIIFVILFMICMIRIFFLSGRLFFTTIFSFRIVPNIIRLAISVSVIIVTICLFGVIVIYTTTTIIIILSIVIRRIITIFAIITAMLVVVITSFFIIAIIIIPTAIFFISIIFGSKLPLFSAASSLS